jgi:DNA adenine methylase
MWISNQTKSFQYLGGKYSILPFVIPILQKAGHRHFVDVFGGSGVVILNMPQSPIETYNDLNNDIVNFFKVLRENTEELISSLQLTPYSKFEYDLAVNLETDSAIEKARKFYIRTQQSIYAAGAQEKSKGWACSINQSRNFKSEKVNKWIRSIESLDSVVARFQNVQIENRDFRFIMKSYDSIDTLFYLDPPYDKTFRSSTTYKFDFENQDFYDLHTWCKKVVGKVAVSGYDTPFMRSLFADFNFHPGPLRKNTRTKRQAFECIWTNY